MRPEESTVRLLPIRFIQQIGGILQANIPVHVPNNDDNALEPTTLQFAMDWVTTRLEAIKKE